MTPAMVERRHFVQLAQRVKAGVGHSKEVLEAEVVLISLVIEGQAVVLLAQEKAVAVLILEEVVLAQVEVGLMEVVKEPTRGEVEERAQKAFERSGVVLVVSFRLVVVACL